MSVPLDVSGSITASSMVKVAGTGGQSFGAEITPVQAPAGNVCGTK